MTAVVASGFTCFVSLHVLLNQMAAIVLCSFRLMFLCEYITCLFGIYKYKVCKSVRHRTIQINHQPVAAIFQFIILTFI